MRKQGYLSQDDRGQGHSGYTRLRFRLSGHTRTVYLGRDEKLIDRIRLELSVLRQGQRLHHELVQLEKQARKTLCSAKKRLAEPLRMLGLHYHGDAVRKFRRSPLIEG